MNSPAWVYEPVPLYMGQETYFAVVTTARLRFIAWIEDGAFVTRMDNGTLHKFDNVAGWIALPDLQNTRITEP
jgi:hypothetical protein